MAARQLDQILSSTELATTLSEAMATTPDGVRDHMHSLQARGLLLIADDGSL
ncbi:hypothetical protein [Streptacidiphilus neutrinimicus]|uniref:hypothetical protein n=1 Tax=Streptacidiphilus neutrinimicus TaxID=105420 RepID=UPI000A9A92DA|nr:hypothetical protein [Streptacidiphilus neutrinimicus]